MQMIYKLLPLFLILLFTACSQSSKEKEQGAWFGGEIINPNTDYIILTRHDLLVDTIPLDDNNRFLYYIDNVKKGLYNFIHNEYQIIYLEPGDSLLLRLNTIDFDESLAFTGRGAERNRYLIDMYLYNEQENQKMPAYYRLPPNEFIPKLDSMKKVRENNLKHFIKKNKPCKPFREVAEANINYDYYTKKELYPFAHYGRINLNKANLSDNYYNFRSEIDYNNAKLQSYYTYFRFLLRHFDHLAYEQYKDQAPYDDNSYIHISNKLNEIDRLVSTHPLKNNLLRSSVRKFILNSKDAEAKQTILETYFTLSTDTQQHSEIKKLSDASMLMMPGNNFPNVTLLTTNGEHRSLKSFLNKKSVIYFWSQNNSNHYLNAHSKAIELKQKYPEYDFIAINTDNDQEGWKNIIQRNNYSPQYEYRFQDVNNAIDKLVINTINKAIIVDEKGVIIDNHTNIFGIGFEEQLLGYLNQ